MEAQVFRVFSRNGINRWKGDVGGRPGGPNHVAARPRGAAPPPGVAAPLAPFGLRVCVSKIGTLGFVSSNSENISRTTFLKYKNSRKQELALRHLVNRLVPENA